MGHDVYICYDEKDREIGEAIHASLEENGIDAWSKSKDMVSEGGGGKVLNVIEGCKCFLLVLSKQSIDTNYIITETDIAFSRNIPILVFNIDNSKLDGNLEFILENQKFLPSVSDPKRQIKNLVTETSDIIGKPAGKVKISSESLRVFEKVNPRRTENNIKKYLKIVIPVCIILVLVYLFVIVPLGQHTTDNGVFAMNITGVDVDGLKYTVHGESFNMPADSGKYFMNLRFFDEKDNLVFEVNSTADEFNSGVIWQGDLHNDNVTHIKFRLTDVNGDTISKQNYFLS